MSQTAVSIPRTKILAYEYLHSLKEKRSFCFGLVLDIIDAKLVQKKKMQDEPKMKNLISESKKVL